VPANHTHIGDQELLERFRRDRDNNWLGILFERYTLLLFGVCMKYLRDEEEAKDAVQQVFLKTITELHKYEVQYFKSWLYMVAKNHCLMKIREGQVKKSDDIEKHQIPDDSDPAFKYKLIEDDHKLEMLSKSLDDLNREQKQCVTLFYLEKRSYLEIAEATGFTVMQVKSHIQNGKRNLKQILEKKLKK